MQQVKSTVILTGASGGLGGAIAHRLQTAGYGIIGTVSSPRRLDELQGKGIDTHIVDLTNEEAVQKFVGEKGKEVGAAILTVGGFALGNFAETDATQLRKMYSLNFETAYFVVRALLPFFEERGGGQFILVGSRPALDAKEGTKEIAYSLSKKLVFFLAELINAEGKTKNIRASVLVPSIINTLKNRKAFPDADYTKWVSEEAIADTIAFLLSDSGSQVREGIIKMYNQA